MRGPSQELRWWVGLMVAVCVAAGCGVQGTAPGGGMQPAAAAPGVPLARTDPGAVDLCEGLRQGWITAVARGTGDYRVQLTVQRQVTRPLRVEVPLGTYFQPAARRQDLVVPEPEIIDLTYQAQASVSLPVFCCNRSRSIPQWEDTLRILPAPPDERLQRLIPVIARRRPDQGTAQDAVWAVTENPAVGSVEGEGQRYYKMFGAGPHAGRGGGLGSSPGPAAQALLREAGLE